MAVGRRDQNGEDTPQNPPSVRKVVKDNPFRQGQPDPHDIPPNPIDHQIPQTKSMGIPDLKGRKQTRLVLASLLTSMTPSVDADAGMDTKAHQTR